MSISRSLSPLLPRKRVVNYRGVPVYRGLAWALEDAALHGAHFSILSGDRRVSTISAFNRQFDTNLHAQQFLVDHQFQPGYNPANPVSQTSHCLRSDGNPVYHGIGPGRPIPWWQLGLDVVDAGVANSAAHTVGVLHRLGYDARLPYSAGSERHHIVFGSNPSTHARRRRIKLIAQGKTR